MVNLTTFFIGFICGVIALYLYLIIQEWRMYKRLLRAQSRAAERFWRDILTLKGVRSEPQDDKQWYEKGNGDLPQQLQDEIDDLGEDTQ